MSVEAGRTTVTVLPITRSPPQNPATALELPLATKRRLGLDDERSWVVLNEANRFVWPGPDVRPAVAGDMTSVVYGPLPYHIYEAVRLKFIDNIKHGRATMISRTE